MTDEIWLSITCHEGTPLTAFSDPETAFDYYGVERVLSAAAGVLFALRQAPDMHGITWAYPSMTSEEIGEIFGDEVERPMFAEERWMIHIWDPIDICHKQVILRPMPVHQTQDADHA